MGHLKQIINENTGISVGVVISLIGGILWLSTMAAKADSTEKAISRIEESQHDYNQNLMEINQRLSRIEGKLERRR